MKTFSAKLLLILCQLFIFSNSWGWGDIGHSAVAEIAERNLTPQAKAMVFNIIGLEPLADAAIFPDSVRSDSRFDRFAAYHFIEIPIGKNYATMGEAEKSERNADTIIQKVPDILANPQYSREQKMVLLRYLVHVVGDVHQPLHVGNGQDMGANLCEVRWKESEKSRGEITKLHSFMDDLIIKYIGKKLMAEKKSWFGYKELADAILREAQAGQLNMEGADSAKVASITKASVNDWYEQSRGYHRLVYPDAIPTAPEKRTYCKIVDPVTKKVVNGSYDAKSIPTVTSDYADRLVPVIKLQILRGGYRLADLLNKTAEKIQDLRPIETKAFVESILISNKPNGDARLPQNEKATKK